MYENFVFENHLGQRFEGLQNHVYLNENDLRDYSWSYDKTNDRISRFYRGITKRKIPLVVVANTGDEANAARNRLHELADVDIAARKPGRVYVGDYYTRGYITASTKDRYNISQRFSKISIVFTSDNPAWFREQITAFRPSDDGLAGASGTDYPYDYSYDYALSLVGQRINSPSINGSAFRIEIMGEITNPTIIIGDHVYSVEGQVGVNEVLTIDSLEKTIVLTTASGSRVNWFDRRNRDSYIFEPIPYGMNVVNWSGNFAFNLTLIDERSEPRWT